MNKLRSEGLLTDEFITDKDDSLFKQKIARGEMFAFIAQGHYPYHSAYGGLYDKVREHTPNAVFANISPFRQSKTVPRVEYRPSNPTYGYRFFVPYSSKNQELVVKVLDWMSSDAGYMVGGLGIEGQEYAMVNGVPVPIDQETYLARVPWIESQYGCMAKPYSKQQDKERFLLSYIKDFNPAYHDQIKQEANFLSDIKYFTPTISLPTPVSDKLSPVVSSFWSDTIAKVVLSQPDRFDRAFDDAIKEYKALGGDEIVAELDELYRKQKQ
jgi:putative aldouronate transport system substrate-binding protein